MHNGTRIGKNYSCGQSPIRYLCSDNPQSDCKSPPRALPKEMDVPIMEFLQTIERTRYQCRPSIERTPKPKIVDGQIFNSPQADGLQISEKYLAPIREHLDRMADAAQSGRTKTGGPGSNFTGSADRVFGKDRRRLKIVRRIRGELGGYVRIRIPVPGSVSRAPSSRRAGG